MHPMSCARRGIPTLAIVVAPALALLAALPALGSSHREAPFVTEHPRVDGTDFYMFRSYEEGRDGFVTLIANYLPLQDAYGGPNYFSLDPEARYRINIENDGDPDADLIFEFRFTNFLNNQALPVGGIDVPVPLRQLGPVPGAPLNVAELYTVQVIRGGNGQPATNPRNGTSFFAKALDYFGEKTFPDYESYAASRIYPIQIPGCGDGRIFVGQRREPFQVNLGETFDLVNLDPVGDPSAKRSSTIDKNITALALEVPIDCLTDGGPVIGGWTSAVLPRTRILREDPTFAMPEDFSANDFVQVSRLGMPLVNEVVIGLPDKDRFNASRPAGDGQLAHYVTNPSFPEIIQILFGVQAPNNFPRQDLVATFVTGIPGLNEIGFGEMQRLNTAIHPTPRDQQSNLGVLGGDNAGFPNGRRPGDDTVDITLRVAMGILCHAFPGVFCDPADAPSGTLPYTDQTYQGPDQFDDTFPYLTTPLAGAPNVKRVYNANLTGGNQVPAIDSPNMGACSVLEDPTLPEVVVSCTHDVGDVVAAHIHNGAAGRNGPIVCDFGAGTSPIVFLCNAATLQILSFEQFQRELREGRLYVNVHSARNPPGEIRGQLE